MGGLGRWLGYALLALAAAAAIFDGIDALRAGDWRPASFLDWWSSLAPGSIDPVMLAWPWLTDTLLAPIAALPAWAVLGVPGAILAFACRRRDDDPRRRRRRRARSF
jgi:hypothetical protein